ncbi:Molybdopterin converting factor, small subunit [Actinomyces ruminicola]|uniref:Molybdopterin synthase sulfur carrier subunit n=2 Tax=Actinomyces ruminicola TaxID=332524 RepID=A0A1H0DMQ5_9ACTO|nr:Molybdopterin converting factor, small subunit [Actinomyces ruminicola]
MTNTADTGNPDLMVLEVHYFAAAAAAAGCAEERLELPTGMTLAGLRELLAGRGLELAKVIGVSSYLVNSVSTPSDSLTELRDGDRVDVLPPFAGG